MSDKTKAPLIDSNIVHIGWRCLCPQCQKTSIYKPGLTLELKDKCDQCGLDLQQNDSADGPAVFLIFILGFLLVPLAIALDFWISPPLWVHAVLWSIVSVILTLGSLRPIKAYIIALQFKHRPQDWDHD